MRKRNILEGIGAALIVLLPFDSKFLSTFNLEIFHLHLPISNVVGGLLIDLLVYAAVFTGFLIAIDRLSSNARDILSALFAGVMVWSSVDFGFEILVHLQYRLERWEQAWGNSAMLILLAAGIVAYVHPRISHTATHAIRTLVAGFAFAGIWIVPQLIHICAARPLKDKTTLAHRTEARNSISNPRVIWILFDELSYEQTFDHPAPGIQLPNFERLRGESTSFSRLRPAGFYTDRIIPSLFSGRSIYEIRSTIGGELQYRSQADGPWTAYDPHASLFALAQRNGWKSGIDGWFNPYCRIFDSIVDACSWEANRTPVEEYGASEDKSALANAAVIPMRMLAPLRRVSTPEERQMQIYQEIMKHAQALIEDDHIQFVFLHIPVPHGPGIFDRKRHVLRLGGDYLDRLVMADDTLGTLMAQIGATASANKTTVIISSDHSWRISLSRNSDNWTDEEERACGGKFDDRPVLLVRFPVRSEGHQVSRPLPELLEHDMIAAMLLGQIGNSDDLDRFISRQDP